MIRATLDKPADTGGAEITLAPTTACPGGAGTNPATSTDYTLPEAFIIPAGETTGTAVVLLPRDNIADGVRTLRLGATAAPTLTVDWVYDTAPCLDVAINDIDSPGVRTNENTLSIIRGQSAPYTIALNTRPTAAVTVTVAVEPSANATATPTSFTITPAQWRSEQEIRVQTTAGDTATVTATLTSTDANYNGRTVAVGVTISEPPDDDADPPPGDRNPPPNNVAPPPPGSSTPTFPGPGGGGDDPPPEFERNTPTALRIPETTDAAAEIGSPVTATGANPVRYSLSGDSAEMFTINTRTGQISLRAGAELDFETGPNSFVLTVIATDTVTDDTVEAQLTITVTDVQLPGKANNYDTDNNETLDLDETLTAVSDYIESELTIEEILAIIRTYLQA